MPLLSHKVGQGSERMLSNWMRHVMTAQFMLSSIKFGSQMRLDVRELKPLPELRMIYLPT